MGVYEQIIKATSLREECLEPRYGDRAIGLRRRESGLVHMEIGGKTAMKTQGNRLGVFGTSETPDKAIWAGPTPGTLHKPTFLHNVSRRHI